MAKVMTLRKLINQLEKVSKNGQNDNLPVIIIGDFGVIERNVSGVFEAANSDDENKWVEIEVTKRTAKYK